MFVASHPRKQKPVSRAASRRRAMRWQAALASLVALSVLLMAVDRWNPVGRGAVSLGQVVDICPGCATGGTRAAILGERVAARAPRPSSDAALQSRAQQLSSPSSGAADLQGRVQQLSSLPAGDTMGAPTQMLPYRVSGDLTVPQSSASTSPVGEGNPDLMIRFAQSHLEQPGVVPPVVPKEIYEDAQSTKRMAAHLKAVLRQQTTIGADMKAKVTKLRAFITSETDTVVNEADEMDATDTALVSKKMREAGIPGQRGVDGTPGKPGEYGMTGMNGRTGGPGRGGRRGVQGPIGEAGPDGRAGTNGPQGVLGPQVSRPPPSCPRPPPGEEVPPYLPLRLPRATTAPPLLLLQGYLAHKKHPSRMTLQQPYA